MGEGGFGGLCGRSLPDAKIPQFAFGGMRPRANVLATGLPEGGGRAGVRQEPPRGPACGDPAAGTREAAIPLPASPSELLPQPLGWDRGKEIPTLPGPEQPDRFSIFFPRKPNLSGVCAPPVRRSSFWGALTPAALAPTRVSRPAAHGQSPVQPSGRISSCLKLLVVTVGPIRRSTTLSLPRNAAAS